MQKSNEKTLTEKRGRGRPATGLGELIGVRIQPDLLAKIDAFITEHHPQLSRPKAILALVEASLRLMEGNGK